MPIALHARRRSTSDNGYPVMEIMKSDIDYAMDLVSKLYRHLSPFDPVYMELQSAACYAIVVAKNQYERAGCPKGKWLGFMGQAIKYRLLEAARTEQNSRLGITGKGRKMKMEVISLEEMGELEDMCDKGPEESLVLRDSIDRVMAAIEEFLPARVKQEIEMYYLEGYTMREIGEKSGISESMVSYDLKEGIEGLKEILCKEGKEGRDEDDKQASSGQ